MCGRYSRKCNLQDLLILFPQNGLRLPAAVRENDWTQAATEIKPNHNENIHFVLLTRFIFVCAAREQKPNKRKLNISELWNHSGKNKYIIDTPPPLRNSLDPCPPPHLPPPLWNFQSPPWERYGYFLQPQITGINA